MAYSGDTEADRQSLVDYARLHGKAMQEHLGYVVDFLHGDTRFKAVLKHAKDLPHRNGHPCRYQDSEKLVARLSGAEATKVRKYLLTVGSYLTNGTKFESVDAAADALIDLKPIPESIYAPEDSLFYAGEPGKTLADMREQV